MTYYRVRIVFNAPVDRVHPFVSVEKESLEEAQQIIEDMKPAIVHAVSVTVQSTEHTLEPKGWRTLTLKETGIHPLGEVL